jgi:serine/threonine protein kinase
VHAVAALNHPNICHLYDVGPDYLVMELVDGPTLAQRIRQGAMPLDETLKIARQVADALEAAHEKGIVHRDLKPGNIILRPDGTVKVLDFGLAKVTGTTESGERTEHSPTLTVDAATRVGVILGTAAYMSPEQARGGVVDKRADIWAFGVVLWELLTGRRLFTGETVSDTLAAVLKTEVDLSPIPMRVRAIVERCLRRDPGQRWHDIADVRIEIEESIAGAKAPWRAEARPTWIAWVIAGGLAVVAAGCAWIAWRATRAVDYPLTRLSVDLGAEAMTGNLTAAISPDGRRLVFPALGPNGKQALATRLLEQSQATLLPETENGRDPFFSPDSQWLGFFADGNLKKLSFQGGAPVTICDVTSDSGASWGEDGTIVAGLSSNSGISRVPATGGGLSR